MHHVIARSLAASLLVAGLAPPASAQNVADYNAYKVMHFKQTTATPPSAAALYYCNLGFDTHVNGAFTTGTVTWSTTTSSSPATLTLSGTDDSTYWNYWWPGPEVATKAALDAMCPATTYTFAVSGGALGSVNGTLALPADAYSSATPAIDAATFARLGALDPGVGLTVTTVAHPAGAGTQYSATYLTIVDAVTNTTLASGQDTAGDGAAVQLQIDGGTLLPAHAYVASVDFTDRVVTANAGFGGATAFTSFEQSTEVDFETLLADGGRPPSDAGTASDAGEPTDAGPTDAGVTPDAALEADAGSPGGGEDAGSAPSDGEDAGAPASSASAPSDGGGGGLCRASAVGAPRETTGATLVGLALIGLVRRRRRATRRLARRDGGG